VWSFFGVTKVKYNLKKAISQMYVNALGNLCFIGKITRKNLFDTFNCLAQLIRFIWKYKSNWSLFGNNYNMNQLLRIYFFFGQGF
jgi:hypothetical protein